MGSPRLRMFAGPNGSGKSTLKSFLPPQLLGIYLNPDDIEREMRQLGYLDFAVYGVTTTAEEVSSFLGNCCDLRFPASKIDVSEDFIYI